MTKLFIPNLVYMLARRCVCGAVYCVGVAAMTNERILADALRDGEPITYGQKTIEVLIARVKSDREIIRQLVGTARLCSVCHRSLTPEMVSAANEPSPQEEP